MVKAEYVVARVWISRTTVALAIPDIESEFRYWLCWS